MRNRGMGMYILDEDGNPKEADTLEWGIWMQTANRSVERTKVGDAEVSTVFLGIDHNWTPHGGPILWETIVFGGPDEMDQNWMDRYDSKDAAVKGHWEMVKRVEDCLSLVDCPECGGKGEYVGITNREDCKACDGRGKIQKAQVGSL